MNDNNYNIGDDSDDNDGKNEKEDEDENLPAQCHGISTRTKKGGMLAGTIFCMMFRIIDWQILHHHHHHQLLLHKSSLIQDPSAKWVIVTICRLVHNHLGSNAKPEKSFYGQYFSNIQ